MPPSTQVVGIRLRLSQQSMLRSQHMFVRQRKKELGCMGSSSNSPSSSPIAILSAISARHPHPVLPLFADFHED